MPQAPRSIDSALTDELADGEQPIAGRLLFTTLVNSGLAPEPHYSGGGYYVLIINTPGGQIWITDDDGQIARPAAAHTAWLAVHIADDDETREFGRPIYVGPGDLTHAQDTAACAEAVLASMAARW